MSVQDIVMKKYHVVVFPKWSEEKKVNNFFFLKKKKKKF